MKRVSLNNGFSEECSWRCYCYCVLELFLGFKKMIVYRAVSCMYTLYLNIFCGVGLREAGDDDFLYK